MNTHDKSCPLRRIIYVIQTWKQTIASTISPKCFLFVVGFRASITTENPRFALSFLYKRTAQWNSLVHRICVRHIWYLTLTSSATFCFVKWQTHDGDSKQLNLSNKSIIKHSAGKSWHRGNHFVHVFLSKMKSKQKKIKDKEILLPE